MLAKFRGLLGSIGILRNPTRSVHARRFHFEECWVEEQGCKEIVGRVWRIDLSEEVPNVALSNIVACGCELYRWNHNKRRQMSVDILAKKKELKVVNYISNSED
ncbi:hypothetical protein JRO89_XS09G0144000 [Xanthoceras sorbifolium]|uniref:Uncharacterized protein n=1 Tax=Xanthoceras sorbifolium TaxID=99658 RepID=A0ABQ8HLA2_9ROSI|nr:hypothetical protein JRO89_XS09G0144000 [Xanthoceras sorbifolium]